LRIGFFGTGEFAVPSLEAIHQKGHEVALVVSQPDRPQGRGLNLRPTPVKHAAHRLGLPVFQPERLRHEPERIIALGAEILVVVAYGQILRANVLECAPRGAVNVHASLLPKYRGAAPIQWAIANGETLTGVTTMQLDQGMDTGPILLQQSCPIEPEDTAATLEPRLAALGAALLLQTLGGLATGSVVPRPQDQNQATRAPLIRKVDAWVDFEQSAALIANRLRGFSPWPGVQFVHNGRPVKILSARALEVESSETVPPGAVVRVSKEGVDVSCEPGSVLRLTCVQPESRSPVSGFDFANGWKLTVGTMLGTLTLESGASRLKD
jgi:methionyl-tRNA formyltransferase